jgi:hypothetical protein
MLPEPSIAEQVAVIKRQVLMACAWLDETRGILHTRRHMANMFKGIPHFRDLRVEMLRAPTIEQLWEVFDRVERLERPS